ncbi:MAG: hypothetical protein Q8R47_03045 [Nanoarchaeota archaeon]|nr:hypothetical protein [Nanoarchaeota archaeon]
MAKILIDLLFWLHIGVIVFGVLMGLFLPLSAVLLLITLHRMQFFIFQDCLLSKLQKRVQGLRPKEHFLQFAVRTIFHKKISKHGAKRLDYMLVLSSIIIAIFNTFY